MEDIIKELTPTETSEAIESIPAPIPDIVEPNNNLRDVGIVVGVVVLAAIFAKLYKCTSKK